MWQGQESKGAITNTGVGMKRSKKVTKPSATGLAISARRTMGAKLFEQALFGVSRIARLHPLANPKRHDVEVIRNVPYSPDRKRAHLLDVYRPLNGDSPSPTVLYVHGGAFRILSKESHWIMGLMFARAGFTVFNINYRLAPRHPYPAAMEDTSTACLWVKDHAAEYGGDPNRIVYAGESAGGNLVTALALASSYKRPEPWARAVWDANPQPTAVIAACAMLQVSDVWRFKRQNRLNLIVWDRLREASVGYLPYVDGDPEEWALADPLVFLERGLPPDRPLPPFFAFAGTRDPLLDDTRRLKAALDDLGVTCETSVYPGGIHAFHALIWERRARRCWRDQFRFLRDQQLVAA